MQVACIIQYSRLDIIAFASRSFLVYMLFTSMPLSGSCLQVRPDLRFSFLVAAASPSAVSAVTAAAAAAA
jgi:cytochrome b561